MTTSAYDIYTFYLEPSDLKGQSHTVKIINAASVEVWDPKLRRKVPRLVLKFENRKKVMSLNKTQAGSMIEISGTDDYGKWGGVEIVLTAAESSNGKLTINITAKPKDISA